MRPRAVRGGTVSGYAPLFDSLSTGSLYGRWPDIGVFPVLLSLADKNGVIDMALRPISDKLGLPLEELAACMRRLCEPDPFSRSRTEDGRRLVLLDPEHRDWGWRVVNHSVYRERARKQQWDLERTASGRNAERMRISRERERPDERADGCRDVPTSSDCARSQTQTQTQTQQEGEARASARPARTAARLSDGWELTEERRQVAVSEGVDPERTFAKFKDHWRAEGSARARKRDWEAAWRNWCRGESDRSRGPRPVAKPAGPSPEAAEQAAMRKLVARLDAVVPGFREPQPGETADQYRLAQDAEYKRREREQVEGVRPIPSADSARPVGSVVAKLAAAMNMKAT